MAIAKLSLAVDRRFKKEGEATADFINCTSFGKTAEVIEKHVRKGTKIAVHGRIQTGSYEGKNGKVYTTDVVIEELEFCESKGNNQNNNTTQNAQASKSPFGPADNEGFLSVPDNIAEEVPFFN